MVNTIVKLKGKGKPLYIKKQNENIESINYSFTQEELDEIKFGKD